MRSRLLQSIALFIFLLMPALSQGQESIVFNKKIHDFGLINEDDDSPSFNFRLTNTGKRPVVISHVSSTCGCTATEYTQSPIYPGKTGTITVTYNPKGRPGKFNRSVSAFITGYNKPVVFTIKGTTTPGSERKYSGYAYVMNSLQLRNNTVIFRPLPGLEQSEVSIMIINSGKESLQIDLESNSPAITGKANPRILRPNEKGELSIVYDTRKTLNGNEKLYVLLNGKKEEKNVIRVEYQKK